MIVNTVTILLALVALSGCAAPPSGTMAPQTGAPQVAAPAAASAEAALDRPGLRSLCAPRARTGSLPDGSTLATEKNLLARRLPQVRVGEDSWYGMGLWIEDIKGIRVISHGGSMFVYKSNFFFVPDAGVVGVILTNADSGWRVATAVMRRTLEVIYDGQPEAEENLLSGVHETRAFLTGEQRDWKVPPESSAVTRLARSYRNEALGEIVVREGKDEVVFQFGGWKSRIASRVNPDGT